MVDNFSIAPLSSSYIKDTADIHAASLPDDFLPNLGTDFLVDIFYPSAMASDYGKVFLALDEKEQPVGFVLVTLDSSKFLKGILTNRLADFIKVGIRSSLTSFKNLKQNIQIVLSGLFSNTDEPFGEIYVIAVKDASRGKGIGKFLVEQSVNYLRASGVQGIRIKTLASNSDWIGFFKKQGWKIEKEFQLIGNKYVSLLSIID